MYGSSGLFYHCAVQCYLTWVRATFSSLGSASVSAVASVSERARVSAMASSSAATPRVSAVASSSTWGSDVQI